MDSSQIKYVVIGGGIAGVTCVETLSLFGGDASITLISASPLIKTVTNYSQITRVAETFDVEEKPLAYAEEQSKNVHVIQDSVTSLSIIDKKVYTSNGQCLLYDKLCICTGGKPRVIAKNNPLVVGIRDTESVKEFQNKVKTARRILIVGNGGIATELVYELEGCEVIWAIKDKSIAHTFVDAGAGEFFLEHLNKAKDNTQTGPSKRLKYTSAASTSPIPCGLSGGALGPDWTSNLNFHGEIDEISHRIHVEREVEVSDIMTPDEFKQSELKESLCWPDVQWPVFVSLTNGIVYGCDLVVSATGVIPNASFTNDSHINSHFEQAEDGGIKVNSCMKTNVDSVFAAGDVCTASWEHSQHWLQMRLWSQARQMGCYAAKCMIADVKKEEISLDFCFELFAHMTTFFKFKVVLLGRFNAQGLENDYEVLLRVTKGEEYVKALLQDGRLVGAVLVGETDLEETFENLILNGLDLTPFKENLLEPGVDVEDFFD
ncbi:pyridine nucleotide-disulfide oxidoreductase domain-containing protein 1 [Plakobranchus ocellatus]|uniref:Pyridine nucleotide-disulfide oxidoreductase domain-containing protein 1 n=1 Tax=Plakobranchus ocellatus TaxID=259542 RepID=A0AAV4C3I9_9GAST|nr:pyridine nucleotide-disulfide oxidoreductase domain-containing protein 1 [Plakobranchus ocellatus]